MSTDQRRCEAQLLEIAIGTINETISREREQQRIVGDEHPWGGR